MEKHLIESSDYIPTAEERAQLVRICTAIAGDRDVAEDLAQEALLEAWRHEQSLRDPTKRSQWLVGIARNVCLRWLRKRGRDAAHLFVPSSVNGSEQQEPLVELADYLADDCDIELELERKELVELLDRALGLLPAETRTVLVKRYVEESPLSEVAAQLGMNTHALTMRLQRGKLALRRVLTQEMREQLDPYALTSEQEWETTPLWCFLCGVHRLQGKRNPDEGLLLLRCPSCSPGPNLMLSNNDLADLKGIKGYKPMYTRLSRWCNHFYRTGLRGDTIACEKCGSPQSVRICLPEELPDWVMNDYIPWPVNERVVNMCCYGCRASWGTITLAGLNRRTPEGQQFCQEYPRTRSLPVQEVEAEGRRALITRFESIADAAHLTVISDYETYEVLRIYRGG